jgi:hypothetical protein
VTADHRHLLERAVTSCPTPGRGEPWRLAEQPPADGEGSCRDREWPAPSTTYRLTVTDQELTSVERQARAATSPDDIDLHLGDDA